MPCPPAFCSRDFSSRWSFCKISSRSCPVWSSCGRGAGHTFQPVQGKNRRITWITHNTTHSIPTTPIPEPQLPPVLLPTPGWCWPSNARPRGRVFRSHAKHAVPSCCEWLNTFVTGSWTGRSWNDHGSGFTMICTSFTHHYNNQQP